MISNACRAAKIASHINDVDAIAARDSLRGAACMTRPHASANALIRQALGIKKGTRPLAEGE